MTKAAELHVIAVGDLSFNGRYPHVLARCGLEFPFRHVLPLWQGADLRLGNLESPLTTAPRVSESRLSLRGPASAAAALRTAGITCVSLANNHAFDYGLRGLQDTMTSLREAGVDWVGAGENQEAAHAPLRLTCRGQSIGVVAFTEVGPFFASQREGGPAPLDAPRLIQQIRALRTEVDWIIVQAHWGQELSRLPSPRQRDLARDLVRAGADLILGHHPHILQPMELVEGVPVYYSLGNFLFSEMYWRGINTEGETFYAKLGLPSRRRLTGWADVILKRPGPCVARLHGANLCLDGTVDPEGSSQHITDCLRLSSDLAAPDYIDRFQAESQAAASQLSQFTTQSAGIRHWLCVKLFQFGLLPNAIEGT